MNRAVDNLDERTANSDQYPQDQKRRRNRYPGDARLQVLVRRRQLGY